MDNDIENHLVKLREVYNNQKNAMITAIEKILP